jgi:HSP20 family molecular chaperone IbpA
MASLRVEHRGTPYVGLQEMDLARLEPGVRTVGPASTDNEFAMKTGPSLDRAKPMTLDTLEVLTTPITTRTSEVAPDLCEDPPPKDAWCPAVNVLRYVDRIEIIVDLAGLNREDVHLSIKDRCLRIQGVRSALEADCSDSAKAKTGGRVLMREIDDGPFARTLSLPKGLRSDPDEVEAHQESGLLWITIPVSG